MRASGIRHREDGGACVSQAGDGSPVQRAKKIRLTQPIKNRKDMSMKTTHTPGPWKVAGSCHVKEGANGLFYHVAHVTLADDFNKHPCIAEVDPRDRFCSEREAHFPSPEQAANARLIASAPELLAAIEQILYSDSPHHETHWEVSTRLISAARRAYDKATRP